MYAASARLTRCTVEMFAADDRPGQGVAGQKVMSSLPTSLAFAPPEARGDAEAHDGEEIDGDDGPVELADGCFHGLIAGEVG